MAHVDYSADNWLAGFADGEGSFCINRKYGRNGKLLAEGSRFYPVFSIGLRADDLAVLDDLRATFGGKLYFNGARETPGRNNAPRYNWLVGKKADLCKLVAYFDAHPLRSKKSRDYAIWRRAVLLYVRHGSPAPELGALREELVEGRVYSDDHEALEAAAASLAAS